MRLGRCAVLVSCILTPTAALAALGDPQADLAVAVTATPDPVAPVAPLSYTVTVTNHGPDASPDTSLVCLVDVGEVASVAPPCQNVGGGDVICALGTIAAGAQVSVTFSEFVFPTPPLTVTNHAHVTGTLPDPALANNDAFVTTTIASTSLRLELAHGTRLAGALLASEGMEGDFYRLRQQPHSSYEIVVDATSGDIIGTLGGPPLERLAPDAGTVLQTAEAVGNGPSRTLRFANESSTAIDDQLVRVRSGVLPPQGDAADVYHVRAFDTTYTVPRFNNVGTQRTVLLLQNPTSRPVRVVASFWTEAGTLLATHTPDPLPAHGLLVLETATVPGLAGASGSITIANDAPYGALAGKAVSLEPLAGFSFDTRMEPRPR